MYNSKVYKPLITKKAGIFLLHINQSLRKERLQSVVDVDPQDIDQVLHSILLKHLVVFALPLLLL